jgi:ornithine cyclodeaminase
MADVGIPFAVYSAERVRTLLDYPGCIAAMREAMANFTASGIPQPLRSISRLDDARLFAQMPGVLSDPKGFGAKLITVITDPVMGRSAHRGVVVLFDPVRGEVACIADAGEVTHIRTAAASVMATDVLAKPAAARLAIFGCGAQATSHVRAFAQARRLEHVAIWGRSPEKASALAAALAKETGLKITAEADPRKAAAEADIICTVTGSDTPVLLGEWVAPGTHVNVIGSSYAGPVEVDTALMLRSRYVADSRASAQVAAAELIVAREAGLLTDAHIVAEIGEVLLGRVPGRTAPEDITFYKSPAHVVQDLAAVTYLHNRAHEDPAA